MPSIVFEEGSACVLARACVDFQLLYLRELKPEVAIFTVWYSLYICGLEMHDK